MDKLRADILVEDLTFAEKNKERGVQRTYLKRPEKLGDGPASARIRVYDSDKPDSTRPRKKYPAAKLKEASGACEFDVGSKDLHHNFKFHQVNVFATMSNLLDRLESPKLLGRTIPWAFQHRSTLGVRPHDVKQGLNAEYIQSEGMIRFGYEGRGKSRVYACLFHDIIAHEFGHAVLTGLKPGYDYARWPDADAFHEYFGDALAMTSSLTMSDVIGYVVKEVLNKNPEKALDGSIISDIAQRFGDMDAAGRRRPMRNAENKLTLDDLEDLESHERSNLLSGVFYDLLQGVYKLKAKARRKRGSKQTSGQRAGAALAGAAAVASRMMLRAVDYCPPVALTFEDYARAVLRADEVAYGKDRSCRDIAERAFRNRGVEPAPVQKPRKKKYDAGVVASIAARHRDAERFVRRDLSLKLPRGSGLEVRRCTARKAAKLGGEWTSLPQETILDFNWDDGDAVCGGLVVFDPKGKVLHYVIKEADESSRLAGQGEPATRKAMLRRRRSGSCRRTSVD